MPKILYFFVICILPLVLSFQSSSFLPRVRLFRKISSVVLKNAEISEQFRSIAVVPKLCYAKNEVVDFIHEWSTMQAETGSAIVTSSNKQGADFSLQFQNNPFLIVNVVEEREHVNVQVREHIDVTSGKAVPLQLRSLLRLTSNNLIDSLSNELNTMILDSLTTEKDISSGPDAVRFMPEAASEDVCELPHYEFTEDEIDFDYLNKHAKDIRTMLPNTAEMNNLWEHENTLKTPSTHTADMDFIDINPTHQEHEQNNTVNISQSMPIAKKQMDKINQEESIYTWETECNINIDIITTAMHIWVRKYMQGAGLSITNTPTGLNITFLNENINLLLTVESLNNRSERVNLPITPFVTAVVAKIQPTSQYNMQSIHLTGHVTFAIQNLVTSLCKELSQVVIPTYHDDDISCDTPPPSTISSVSDKCAPRKNCVDNQEAVTSTAECSFAEIEEAVRGVQRAHVPARANNAQGNSDQSASSTTASAKGSSSSSTETTTTTTAATPLKVFKRRDPATMAQAAELGLRLEKFEGCGLEDAAMAELNAMLHNTQKEGFLNILKEYNTTSVLVQLNTSVNNNTTQTRNSVHLQDLFQQGQQLSALSLLELLQRPTLDESAEELLKPTPQLPMLLNNPALARGDTVDIFQSPSELRSGLGHTATTSTTASIMDKITTSSTATTGTTAVMPPPNPSSCDLDQQRLSMLVTELGRTDPAFHDSILEGFRELFYSDSILYLLKCANTTVVNPTERQLYKKITEKTLTLMAELGALIKTESMRHLQTISDICTIAADYQHDERQFQERMYYIKPRFDTALLSYLTHAIQEEELQEKQRGIDPQLAPSVWLQILSIVKKGVTAEFELRYRNQLEMLLLVVRFDDSAVRSEIFRRFVSLTPAMELPYLKALALNMIDGILGTDYGGQIPAAVLSDPTTTTTTTTAATTDTVSTSNGDSGIVKTSHSHINQNFHPDPNPHSYPHPSTQQQHQQPAQQYSLSSAALADPTLVPRMEALLQDVNTHLSEQFIHTRIQAFQEEVRQQGKNVVVRHRNSVIRNERETVEEIASSRD